MTKPEIQQRLLASHTQFLKRIANLSERDFLLSANGKWTAGQQLEHIIKSVSPVKLALTSPRLLLKLSFGKANRASRTYDALVEKYQAKLAAGGLAPVRFIPKAVSIYDRNRLLNRLYALTESLSKKVDSFTEEQLDFYILPHPLLGKLTIREMLLFTIYHVGHHEKQVIQNLQRAA